MVTINCYSLHAALNIISISSITPLYHINLSKPAPLVLCGRELLYVAHADHLGNMLTEQGDKEKDTAQSRGPCSFSLTLKQENCSSGLLLIKATKVYSSSCYKSNIWDLGGEKAKKVYMLGARQSSWPGAAHSGLGHTYCSSCFVVDSALQELISCAICKILSQFEDQCLQRSSGDVHISGKSLARTCCSSRNTLA